MQNDSPPSDEHFYDREMSESPSQSPHPSPSPAVPVLEPAEDNAPPVVNDEPNEAAEASHEENGEGGDDGSNGNNSPSPQTPQRSQEQSREQNNNLDSPRDIEMEDSPPPSQASSLFSLSNRVSSPTPDRGASIWSPNHIMIPDSVTDAIRHQLCMERFFHPNRLMQPREQDLNSLDANGKVWAMERQPLSNPIDGVTWSFVDECHAGITNELLKVIYFFDIVNGLSNHFNWNGFVVPTTDISGQDRTFLQPNIAPNGKDIIGVMLSQYMESEESVSFGGTVDTDRLLAAGELSASGIVVSPQQLFRISVGFTAAVFESSRVRRNVRGAARDSDPGDEDEQRQAIFGVVTVTTLQNVDSLRLILVCTLSLFPLTAANTGLSRIAF